MFAHTYLATDQSMFWETFPGDTLACKAIIMYVCVCVCVCVCGEGVTISMCSVGKGGTTFVA